jgi:hypothetical protein
MLHGTDANAGEQLPHLLGMTPAALLTDHQTSLALSYFSYYKVGALL